MSSLTKPRYSTKGGFPEKHVEHWEKEDYEGLSLQKLRGKKVGDAFEVLTDQAGIQDFMMDGGNLEVYFWYDPHSNRLIQDRVEDGLWAGIFDHEEEAATYLQRRELYCVDQNPHFQRYRARLELLETAENLKW